MVSPNGDVATNAHVVTNGQGAGRQADEVYVQFADGNQVPAKIVGTDPNADVALLRVDPKGLRLRVLPLGPPTTSRWARRSRRSGRRSTSRSRSRSA